MGKTNTTFVCSKCLILKDSSRFEIYDNGRGERRRRTCKDCRNERTRGKRKDQSKAYYKKYKTKIKLYQKSYYRENRETFLLKGRAYYNENKDTVSLKVRAKTYNTSVENIESLLSGGCEVCGSDGTEHKKGLHIDHCHVTGKIRGCLCHNCNTALGLLKEDIKRIEKLMEYISDSNSKT